MLLLQPTYTLLTADIVCLFALASEYKLVFKICVVSAIMSPALAVVNTRTNSPSFGCYRPCTKKNLERRLITASQPQRVHRQSNTGLALAVPDSTWSQKILLCTIAVVCTIVDSTRSVLSPALR